MNHKMVFRTVGKIVLAEAAMLLLPTFVSLLYGENCIWSFLITIAVALVIGGALVLGLRPKDKVIYAKEGFVIVALAWLSLSLIGALPFTISGEIPSYIDAVFETVSGFTTTGASILTDVESMSYGLLFWRSFTLWVGGMGVLVFAMAIIPNFSDRSIHILRAEVPGPTVGKLVPRMKDTAKILYLIYIVMTVLEIILLLCGGMPLFDSVVHSLGTAGTGGFGIKADSIGGYSPYLQWVIGIFMLLFGINFNLYYLLLIRQFKPVFKSGELWAYIGITTAAVVLICVNIWPLYEEFSEVLRQSFFQVSSILTTTGYATTDFNQWPDFSKAILLLLMCIGGCAGSTAGGIKVSRVVMIFKQIGSELQHMLHPRSVKVVHFEGKKVDQQTLHGVGVYLMIYVLCLAAVTLVVSLDPFGLETNLSAAMACFNNIGPGLGIVGPAGSYAAYSNLSKAMLTFAMLFGRLEIFPMLLFFSPATWSKKG